MRVRVVASFLLCGCAYPDFAFNELVDGGSDESTASDTRVVGDTNGNDTNGNDTSVDDSSSTDTSIADSTAKDTAPPDTTVVDVSVDTAPIDTAPKTGCAAALHDFCVDWDLSTEPTYGWTAPNTTTGATIAVDSVAFSPPRSALISIPAGSGVGIASLSRNLIAPSDDRIGRVDVRIRFNATTYAPGVMLFKLQRLNHGASIWLGGAGLYAEAYGAAYRTMAIAKPLTAGVWYRMRLEANLKVSSATVRVYIDDMTTPLVDVNDVSTVVSPGTDRTLVIGPYVDNPAYGAWSVRYDDVSLDWL